MQSKSRQYGSERSDRERNRSRSRSRRRSQSRSRERHKRREKEDKKYRDRSRSSDRGRRHYSRRSSSRDVSDRRRRSSSRRRSNGEHRGEKHDESSSGPKPVTLKDIISANPGISMPEAVMKLNSYNSAIARGENPPPLSGQAFVGSTQTATLGEGGALTKSQREIYVGNLPPGLAVPQLSEFLNAAMKQIGVGKDQSSVVTAWISPDAHYAFVEFRTVEEANAALNHLNGIQVGNYSLRFGRTKGYAGSVNTENCVNSSHLSSLSTLASGLLHPVSSVPAVNAVPSIIAEPLSDVIMVTNIPPVLDEQQVRDLFTPFGELKVFNIIKTGGNQGQSAVFEYVQSSIADAVVSGMNNLDVIGQKLSVQKVPQSSAAVLLKPIKSVTVEKKLENLECSDDLRATTVLRLSNMVTAEDLADDELYSELIEDVADECNQYGTVLSVIIPRSSNDTTDESGVGKIFVQLSDVEGAKRVRKAVSGRKFNGRIVEAEYFAEELFQKQIYSIPSQYKPAEGTSATAGVDLD